MGFQGAGQVLESAEARVHARYPLQVGVQRLHVQGGHHAHEGVGPARSAGGVGPAAVVTGRSRVRVDEDVHPAWVRPALLPRRCSACRVQCGPEWTPDQRSSVGIPEVPGPREVRGPGPPVSVCVRSPVQQPGVEERGVGHRGDGGVQGAAVPRPHVAIAAVVRVQGEVRPVRVGERTVHGTVPGTVDGVRQALQVAEPDGELDRLLLPGRERHPVHRPASPVPRLEQRDGVLVDRGHRQGRIAAPPGQLPQTGLPHPRVVQHGERIDTGQEASGGKQPDHRTGRRPSDGVHLHRRFASDSDVPLVEPLQGDDEAGRRTGLVGAERRPAADAECQADRVCSRHTGPTREMRTPLAGAAGMRDRSMLRSWRGTS